MGEDWRTVARVHVSDSAGWAARLAAAGIRSRCSGGALRWLAYVLPYRLPPAFLVDLRVPAGQVAAAEAFLDAETEERAGEA